MLLSLALVFLFGLALGKLFERFRLPRLLGMLVTGILLGPQVFNLLDAKIISISPDLRQLALIIILFRAGLNLDLDDLKKVGRPAILLCFVPASLEIIGMILLAPLLFDVSVQEAAVMGSVVAAVSPAVVVPRMLKLMEEGYGIKKGIPQMIMSAASVDDVYVIVLFAAFTGIVQGGEFSPAQLLSVPSAIVLGLISGICVGILMAWFFRRFHIRDTGKVVILLSVSFLFVSLEQAVKGPIGFSGLLAVMALGGTLRQRLHIASKRLSIKFSKLWVAAEVILFVLVGSAVDISFALQAGALAVFLILSVMAFRMLGVFVSLIKTNLNTQERLFTGIAYLPKATVQAAIGGVPLAMGLKCGNIVLTVAVLSILITAPLGASLIDFLYKKFLAHDGAAPLRE